jgi:hypothetical protein
MPFLPDLLSAVLDWRTGRLEPKMALARIMPGNNRGLLRFPRNSRHVLPLPLLRRERREVVLLGQLWLAKTLGLSARINVAV